jgi:hypothetical protein
MKQAKFFHQFGPGRVDDLLARAFELCKQGVAVEHRSKNHPVDFYFEDLSTGFLWRIRDSGDAGAGMKRVDHYFYADPAYGPSLEYLPPTYLEKYPEIAKRAFE